MHYDLETILLILTKVFNHKDIEILEYHTAHEHIINKTLIKQGQSQVISYLESLRDGKIDSGNIKEILKEE